MPIERPDASINFTLRYGAAGIGVVEEAFLDDGIWYGLFKPAVGIPEDVRTFIDFCRTWNERMREWAWQCGRVYTVCRFVRDGTWTAYNVKADKEIAISQGSSLFLKMMIVTFRELL